jgi:hypothetical protein
VADITYSLVRKIIDINVCHACISAAVGIVRRPAHHFYARKTMITRKLNDMFKAEISEYGTIKT